jgi:hypothetical protein
VPFILKDAPVRNRITVFQGTPLELLIHLGFVAGYVSSLLPPDLQAQALVDKIGQKVVLHERSGAARMLTHIKRIRVIDDNPRRDVHFIHRTWLKKPVQLQTVPGWMLVEAETFAFNTYEGKRELRDSPEMYDLPFALKTLMLVHCTSSNYIYDLPSQHRDDEVCGRVRSIDIQFPNVLVRGSLTSLMLD